MDFLNSALTTPVALAVVALLGYLVGRRRPQPVPGLDTATRRLQDANNLIVQVESISDQLRRSMAAHHCTVSRFHEQFRTLSQQPDDAEPAHHIHLRDMLAPAQRLTDDIAQAYDELRQQTCALQRLRRCEEVEGD